MHPRLGRFILAAVIVIALINVLNLGPLIDAVLHVLGAVASEGGTNVHGATATLDGAVLAVGH